MMAGGPLFSLSICSLLGCAFAEQALLSVRYDIICDAGSTGTRMYLFTQEYDDAGRMKVTTEKIGKRKPGLSAYADNPEAATPPLIALFAQVLAKIPESHWPFTSVSVLGTAGMRSLTLSQQEPIYNAVRQTLLAAREFVFPHDKLKIRTLSGTEEGTFVLLGVNYLTGRLDHRLELTDKGIDEKLLGVLDLGGSSTQIAVPPVSARILSDLHEGSVVRSYAAYGMEQMRFRVDKHAIAKKLSSSPCYFKDYREKSNGLIGSGHAESCREMLMRVLEDARGKCAGEDVECMPGSDESTNNAGALGMEFFAVSGYLFVTDFASHWLQQRSDSKTSSIAKEMKKVGNRPTLDELERAADALCESDWGEIERATAGGAEAGAHRYTDSKKAPHRCLEVNYVITLLRHCYGFADDQRLVTFEDEVDGNDVEWPMGALLRMRLEDAKTQSDSLKTDSLAALDALGSEL